VASVDVDLKTDDTNRIFFAHSPYKAFIFTLLGAGFTWLSWRFIPAGEVLRFVFVGFSLIFVLVGILGVFWRLELDIDLGSRRVRMRKGMWPMAKTSHRPLDEADGIWLTLKYRSSGSKNKRKVPWWFVSFKFPEEKRGTRIFASASEIDSFQKWEYYAKRLQLDAVDATANEEQRKSWKELDENLAAKRIESRPTPNRSPTPPAGSTIELVSNRGRREILLPAAGFTLGLVFISLFGGVFVAMGASVWLATAGILDMQVNGSEVVLNIVPPIFVLVGLGIIWLGIKGSYSALIIGVENGMLFTQYLAFGKRSGKQSVALADIESVAVAGDVRSRRRDGGHIKIGGMAIGTKKSRERDDEVVVRSDRKILRFGSSLNEDERVWLAEACHYAAVRGQLP